MLEIAQGWPIDVERGPDWLFIRLHEPQGPCDDCPPLAERLWDLMEEHCVQRAVIELDDLSRIPSYMIGQLVLLHKRVHQSGGLLRLSGLSRENQRVLEIAGLRDRLPIYPDRGAAVMGHLPNRPR